MLPWLPSACLAQLMPPSVGPTSASLCRLGEALSRDCVVALLLHGSAKLSPSASAPLQADAAEQDVLGAPVLMAVNVERRKQGLEPAPKLTVQLLKTHLRGKLIRGQEWKAGNKKKDDLVSDYRCGLCHVALRPTVVFSALVCWLAMVCWCVIRCALLQLESATACAMSAQPATPLPVSALPSCSAPSCGVVDCHLLLLHAPSDHQLPVAACTVDTILHLKGNSCCLLVSHFLE